MPDCRTVLTFDQALAEGLSVAAIRHRVETHRWQRPHPGVLVTHSGSLLRDEELAAALAYAGPAAALSHHSAAERHGLRKRSGSGVSLTIPHHQRLTARRSLTIHRSRLWTPADVKVVKGLRCTTVERTVLDLAAAESRPSRAIAVIADAVGSRRTTSARLLEHAGRHNRLRHRSAIWDALSETAEGAQSALEVRDAKVCRDHGLPIGVRQRRFVLNGRVAYVDNIVEEFGVVTELDGRLGHDETLEKWRDMDRDNAHVEQGRHPLRLGWEDLLDRPCQVARRRAATLRRYGWEGQARPCGPGCPVNDSMPGKDHVALATSPLPSNGAA